MKVRSVEFMHVASLAHTTKTSYKNNRCDTTFTSGDTSASKPVSKNVLSLLFIASFIAGSVLIGRKLLANKTSQFKPDTFHNDLALALKKEGISVLPEDLTSIVSPKQFSKLIQQFKPYHFNAGLQVSEKKASAYSLDEFYKNSINGNFRVSLHTHSNFSDGKASPELFLENAQKYADKVASMNKNDDLPPFTIALTDHDSVGGCAEIIKLIAKNPQKYKNLKFVAGCEFSVRDGDLTHDITGLALNPFDKELKRGLEYLAEQRVSTVNHFLDSRPLVNDKKITRDDLIALEQAGAKQGKMCKRTIENAAGVVSVRNAIKSYYKLAGKSEEHNLIDALGNKDILPIDNVLKMIKNNGGYASLTHPIKSFWRYIGDNHLMRLKNKGVDGIEVNHQYSPSTITKLGNLYHGKNPDKLFDDITREYSEFAKKNNMFLAGGTDSHEKHFFGHSPKISDEFLQNKLLK